MSLLEDARGCKRTDEKNGKERKEQEGEDEASNHHYYYWYSLVLHK